MILIIIVITALISFIFTLGFIFLLETRRIKANTKIKERNRY